MSIWNDLWELLFPRLCVVCGKKLLVSEDMVCFSCMSELPRTGLSGAPGNEMEKLFWGRFPVERASALFYYSREGKVARILAGMKYHGRKDMCFKMGGMLADELLPVGFFDGVDCLIPVPLHPKRLRRRGYNQSEWLARGLSAVTGIPVDGKSVTRDKDTDTQTHKSVMERQDNVAGIFSLHAPEAFKGKHVLIVDDVFTTGATVTACADALDGVEGVQVSVLTLAVAGS